MHASFIAIFKPYETTLSYIKGLAKTFPAICYVEIIINLYNSSRPLFFNIFEVHENLAIVSLTDAFSKVTWYALQK